MTTNIGHVSGPRTNTAFVNVSVFGDNEIVAAVPGRRIRVTRALIQNRGASLVGVLFRSATTPITATHPLAVNGGGFSHVAKKRLCQTEPGEALNLRLDDNIAVAATIEYELI